MREVSAEFNIGKVNSLEVYKKSDFGLFLRAKNEDEVLLPNAYVTSSMKIGDVLELFLYHDSQDRVVATTLRPTTMVDEYGYFKVVDVKSYGAFVDWGLPKDLFVPISHQKEYFRIGDWKILRVCQDKQTDRLYASQKLGKFLWKKTNFLNIGDKLDILVIATTPLGYKVIANNKYEGMLFRNEVFKPLKVGDRDIAYIKKIRPDGKLDMQLQPVGKTSIEHYRNSVVTILKNLGGEANVTTKSTPQEISKLFAISKKSFKSAVNSLIEDGTLVQSNGYIQLKSSHNDT